MSEHKPLTDEKLAEMQARCDAATPGPWIYDEFQLTIDIDLDPLPENTVAQIDELRDHAPDGEFIAHARTDLPQVLADNERLRAEVERLKVELRPEQIACAECTKLSASCPECLSLFVQKAT